MTTNEYNGRVALVTAAAGAGIGQAIARRLAEGGARVVVTDIHERRTKEVTDAIAADTGADVIGIPFDVCDLRRAPEVVAETTERLGPVQILVNNAALNVQGPVFDYDPETFERGLRANLTAPWYLGQLAFPGMRDAGGGTIINISSVAPDTGGAEVEPPYACAKGGLHALTRGMARAGGPYNVRCNAVTMGVVTGTRFIDAHPELVEDLLPLTPLGRHGTPADIAETVAFLASDRAAFITGEIINVAGGYYMRP